MQTATTLIKPAGKDWTIKAFMSTAGKPMTWNGMHFGLTVAEHKYTHEGNGGYYDIELLPFDGKTWLIYECSIPESVKKHVRATLKEHGMKYHRVMDAAAMGEWVNDIYTYLGQIVSKESKGNNEAYMRQMAKTRFNILYKRTEYRAYKALVDNLACEQLEEYYEHVMGVKL